MEPARGRQDIFWINLFNINEYVAPLLLVLAAAVLLYYRWKRSEGQRATSRSLSPVPFHWCSCHGWHWPRLTDSCGT
jgi:hypothetical protein